MDPHAAGEGADSWAFQEAGLSSSWASVWSVVPGAPALPVQHWSDISHTGPAVPAAQYAGGLFGFKIQVSSPGRPEGGGCLAELPAAFLPEVAGGLSPLSWCCWASEDGYPSAPVRYEAGSLPGGCLAKSCTWFAKAGVLPSGFPIPVPEPAVVPGPGRLSVFQGLYGHSAQPGETSAPAGHCMCDASVLHSATQCSALCPVSHLVNGRVQPRGTQHLQTHLSGQDFKTFHWERCHPNDFK